MRNAKGECFQLGEIWESPKGTLYKVVDFISSPGSKRRAVLRLGLEGKGRKSMRDWDAVTGWAIHTDATPAVQE